MAVSVEQRVAHAAEAAGREQGYVSPVDVLVGLGWLAPVHRDEWQQGRVPYLEQVVQVGPEKISTAVRALQGWAAERGFEPRETPYVTRTRDSRSLRFSADGDPSVERAYRTHWVSPALKESERSRIIERASRPPDLVVIAPLRDWTCAGCGGTGDLLLMEDDAPLCLACADLEHLVYLPAGDPALTRRAKKASRLSAVVVRFSRARKRYERQGILVEEPALADAETSCLADAEARERRRGHAEERRSAADSELAEQLAEQIRRLFPGCPPERAEAIAAHTAVRGSGRIGRTAAGQRLDEQTVQLAVIASVRHRDTDYDSLHIPQRALSHHCESDVAERPEHSHSFRQRPRSRLTHLLHLRPTSVVTNRLTPVTRKSGRQRGAEQRARQVHRGREEPTSPGAGDDPTPRPADPGERRSAATACGWCGTPMQPKPRGRIPKWCSPSCRQRAWEQARAAASGRSAVRVVERPVQVRTPLSPTRHDWPRLLQELAHQLDDGRVYDRDLLGLAGALTAVLEAYRRRPYVRDRAAAGHPDDLLG